jgi:delta14-sterol reductase
MQTALGFFAPWIIQGLVLALHVALPARKVAGYVTDSDGSPLRYRLNGLLVLLTAVLGWWCCGAANLVPYDFLYHTRWEGLAGAVALGLGITVWLVYPAQPTGKGSIADYYYGRLSNPQWLGGRVDAKMLLYLVGAVLLELNLLSFGAFHRAQYPESPSVGVTVYIVLFTWFVVDYLTFERVHLWTYDFFAENVGFKLGWGCICFYPYFYVVSLWATADLADPEQSTLYYLFSGLVFGLGWLCSRGANLQKFTFKTEPSRVFWGVIRPKTISDGSRSLLVSGFWGAARHVNYFGELLMAIGLALSLGHPYVWWVWLYPLYYVVLLFPRERDDDRRCAQKYGALWEEYRARVPYRIIPGIY